MSAILSFPFTWLTLTTLAATASLTLWYAIALCFFLRVLDGRLVLNTTPLLSHRIWLGPKIGIPIILSLYLNSMRMSTEIRRATNFSPYVEVSTVFCHFEYHFTGVLLTNNSISVTDLLVVWSCAWAASTYATSLTPLPFGHGQFFPISRVLVFPIHLYFFHISYLSFFGINGNSILHVSFKVTKYPKHSCNMSLFRCCWESCHGLNYKHHIKSTQGNGPLTASN